MMRGHRNGVTSEHAPAAWVPQCAAGGGRGPPATPECDADIVGRADVM